VALILVICTALTFSLSACKDDAGSKRFTEDIADATVMSFYKEVRAVPVSGTDYSAEMNKYLVKRLKLMGFKPAEDKAGNIVVNIAANNGFENAPCLILQSRIDADASYGIATILSVLAHPEAKGAIRVLFTEDVGGDMAGAGKLKTKKNLDGELLISLDGADAGSVVTTAPGAAVLKATTKVGAAEPTQKRAYVIAASGFDSGRPPVSGEYPGDPIKIITEVLTAVRSGGIMYELASFKGGTDAYHLPSKAVAVVVVGDYEMKQFRKIFDGVRDEYLSKFDEDTVDISMIETTMPAEVITSDDSDDAVYHDTGDILTHLFGLLSSNIGNKEGDAALYLSTVDLTPQQFISDATIYSTDLDEMEAIVAQQAEFQKLTGIIMEISGNVPGFYTPADSPLTERITEAYKAASGEAPSLSAYSGISELGFIHEKKPELPIYALGTEIAAPGTSHESVEEKGMAVPANTIMEYIRKNSANK
jgi:hypothetical protein